MMDLVPENVPRVPPHNPNIYKFKRLGPWHGRGSIALLIPDGKRKKVWRWRRQGHDTDWPRSAFDTLKAFEKSVLAMGP